MWAATLAVARSPPSIALSLSLPFPMPSLERKGRTCCGRFGSCRGRLKTEDVTHHGLPLRLGWEGQRRERERERVRIIEVGNGGWSEV